MAWGITIPNRYSPFWPDGDIVGWEEQLLEYRNSTMPENEKKYFSRPDAESHRIYVANKLRAEPGVDFGGDYPPFGPIATLEVPKLFATRYPHASLGSLVFVDGSIFAVDQALKDIIEHTEPSMHFFSPIKFLMPTKRGVLPASEHEGVAYPGRYYYTIIKKYVDGFASEQSEPDSFDVHGTSYTFRDYHMKGLALRKPAIANAHLWLDRKVFNMPAFLSDQIVKSIKSAGLRIPKLHKLKEV